MPFNPTSSAQSWKKHVTPAQPPVNITYGSDDLTVWPSRNYRVINEPNWLQIQNISFNSTSKEMEFQAVLVGAVINTLLPGTYTANLKCRYDINIFFGWATITTSVTFTFTLTLLDTVLLSLTPSTLTYQWTIGEALPQNQLVQVQTETSWLVETITQTWITTNIASGVGNSQLVVTVNPTGLSAGNYTGQIAVRDGNNFLKYVDIFLTVLGEDTDEDYLYVSPNNFSFVSEFEEENTKEIALTLDASDSWTATPSHDWIVISDESGSSGINDLTVSVDSDELAVGAYQGSIEFANDDIVKTVYVSLQVIEFFTSGIESDTLYFVDDRNKLSISTTSENTYLQLDTVAATGSDNIPYVQEAPYLQGVATILIGQEANNLQGLVTPTNSFTSRIQNNITPVNIGFTAFNVNKFTDAISQVAQFQNLLFLKGKTPVVTDKLCYIPENITIPNNSVLSLSILATDAPTEIVISGDAEATISSGIDAGLYVYNAIVNVSTLDLAVGNTINITFGSLEINATIKEASPEENILAFENEWGEMEFFNTTGFLTKMPTIADTTTEVATNGQELTKVVTIDYGVEYTLNTGFIYSQEEIDWLATILKAKRKFIYEAGEPVEIILSTKNLETYETRRNYNSYALKFKRALI